jgi:hypothetical protein
MAFRRCNMMLGRNSIVSANMRKTKGFLSREGVNVVPQLLVCRSQEQIVAWVG